MSKSTLVGGCCCGAVRYAVSVALPEPPVLTRCNCTFCTKSGHTGMRVEEPAENLRITAPAGGEAELLRYVMKNPGIEHFACARCAIHLYVRADFEHGGRPMRFTTFNASTLDQPQEGIDLSKFKFRYVNGLQDAFTPPQDVPFSGGFV